MKIIITILAAVVIIDVLIVYACCVVAGRADDVAEKWMNEEEATAKAALPKMEDLVSGENE